MKWTEAYGRWDERRKQMYRQATQYTLSVVLNLTAVVKCTQFFILTTLRVEECTQYMTNDMLIVKECTQFFTLTTLMVEECTQYMTNDTLMVKECARFLTLTTLMVKKRSRDMTIDTSIVKECTQYMTVTTLMSPEGMSDGQNTHEMVRPFIHAFIGKYVLPICPPIRGFCPWVGSCFSIDMVRLLF
jgi:hypothetical protein